MHDIYEKDMDLNLLRVFVVVAEAGQLQPSKVSKDSFRHLASYESSDTFFGIFPGLGRGDRHQHGGPEQRASLLVRQPGHLREGEDAPVTYHCLRCNKNRSCELPFCMAC
ncbi:hypothetical protein ACN28S_64870 [Cystobacter fuscus]